MPLQPCRRIALYPVYNTAMGIQPMMRTAAAPNRFERDPALITRANLLAGGAAGVVPSWDERGNFVCNAAGVALAFIPRHLRRDGVWLVRAAEVAGWLGVPVREDGLRSRDEDPRDADPFARFERGAA